MKLQEEKSSMQDQQTCATMRSDCPQKAETQNKGERKNKQKQNAITGETNISWC